MTAHAAAFTLMPHALPISFLVNADITGIWRLSHNSRTAWVINSSQSEAMNTHFTFWFSSARCVSLIPTATWDILRSSKFKSITYFKSCCTLKAAALRQQEKYSIRNSTCQLFYLNFLRFYRLSFYHVSVRVFCAFPYIFSYVPLGLIPVPPVSYYS